MVEESEEHLLHPLQQPPFRPVTLCSCSPLHRRQQPGRRLPHKLGVRRRRTLRSMVVADPVAGAAGVPRDIERVAAHTGTLPTHDRHGGEAAAVDTSEEARLVSL